MPSTTQYDDFLPSEEQEEDDVDDVISEFDEEESDETSHHHHHQQQQQHRPYAFTWRDYNSYLRTIKSPLRLAADEEGGGNEGEEGTSLALPPSLSLFLSSLLIPYSLSPPPFSTILTSISISPFSLLCLHLFSPLFITLTLP